MKTLLITRKLLMDAMVKGTKSAIDEFTKDMTMEDRAKFAELEMMLVMFSAMFCNETLKVLGFNKED